MDFLKTLLIYMVALLSASTTGEVQTTPLPPSTAPTAYVTTAPTRIPTVAPTLAPIVTPSPTPIVYTTLYVGDRGENVRRLQRRLAELGYLNDTIDGIYGQKTKRAVERFQYYNGLNSDGVAGQSTQYMLYESRSVIVAPPDITASPSPTPTPYVQRQVYVPIYYVDRAGVLLARTGITMYASGTIYADSTMVSSSYTLASSSSVYVYLNGNYATPASVTFTYDRLTTPAPTAPAPVYIPVYYMAEDNSILYITTCSLARNVTTTVYAQSSLIDSRYRLISASSVDVYVNSAGTPSPASVIFRYSDSSATATPSPTPSAIAYNVYYITEYEELLFTDTVYLDKGRESTVYANSSLVPSGYQLISASSVRVSVSSSGDASPTTVRFTYRKPQTPTPPPSATPTPPPVAYSVYYVTDQDDLLYTDIVYLDRGRESTVYANSSLVPTDYVLTSASSAQVRVAENGDSTPSTVRFIYRKPATPTPRPATPTPTPSPIAYNVYYVTESGDMLYNDIVYLDKGRESTVYANASFVTPDYVLIGADSVQVTVSEYGDPTPGVARFTYRIPETPTPPPVETPTPPPAKTPTPPPVETPPPPSAPSGILSPGGTSISVNGITKQGGWYKNDNGAPYLAVDRLADLMGVGYSSDNGEIIYNINGHRVAVRSAAGIARGLSIDGSDRSSSAFSMNGGMYIEEMLLSELGIRMTIDGNTMILNY